MPTPPLLPEVVLARVVRVARFDGLSVLAMAGSFAIINAVEHNSTLAAVGLAAAGAGALELHGVSQLENGDPRGMRGLLFSQPVLLFAVLGYCALRLWFIAPPPMPEMLHDLINLSAQQLGLSAEAYIALINRLTMSLVAIASVGVQGGMFIYYWRRRATIEQALAVVE